MVKNDPKNVLRRAKYFATKKKKEHIKSVKRKLDDLEKNRAKKGKSRKQQRLQGDKARCVIHMFCFIIAL